MRLGAVSGVLSLYRLSENTLGLRDFKGRFLERFKELPYDIDERVAVKGVRRLAA